MKRALFIGRFQPFHAGHLSVLQALGQAGYEEIIIGIGSAQYQRTLDNPLSLTERLACISLVLQVSSNIPHCVLVPIEDIHDDSHWVEHVDGIVSQYASQYTATYTGNDLVKRLFEAAGKPVAPVEKTIDIDGTRLRQWLLAGQTDWKQFVHPAIQAIVAQAVQASSHES